MVPQLFAVLDPAFLIDSFTVHTHLPFCSPAAAHHPPPITMARLAVIVLLACAALAQVRVMTGYWNIGRVSAVQGPRARQRRRPSLPAVQLMEAGAAARVECGAGGAT